MKLENNWNSYKEKLSNSLSSITDGDISLLSSLIEEMINNGNEIHILGNGGSAANANHINGDFTKTFSTYGKTIKISTHADTTSFLTAVANDMDYSEIFTLLIPSRISKEDLVIFLSGSGNSINLVKCAEKANKYKINTFCLTGFSGGKLKNICKNYIHVPVNDMEIIEDIQLIIFHCIKQLLCRKIEKLGQSATTSPKYEKRVKSNEIA